ncbi:HAD family hydrolase [Streptomyces sp. NPDC058471]|uniref:HAD family hydrolase n=1 Tax=Streptomyces sp. NPDC058471 TaxID=3346516 RepID=UPI003667EDA4
MSTSLSAINTHPVSGVLFDGPLWQDSAPQGPRPSVVILDLFGTLVAAPSQAERNVAAIRFAEAMRVLPTVAESALSDSWRVRHDGRLKSTTEVAAYLVARCDAPASHVTKVEQLLAELARDRLQADASLLRVLKELRHGGVRLAVLSDASPDIAEAWSHSDLAPHFDAAVFSCRASAVKPAPQLFGAALEALGVASKQALYCGDGGGDELAGAERAGMRVVRVERRGGQHRLAFGETAWLGRAVPDVEALPSLLNMWGDR